MSHPALTQTKIQKLRSKIIDYGRLVRFSHTVFALPFAMSSVALAWPKHPVSLQALFWILVAMVGARTAAMGFNRLVDQKFDALNPRTRGWELPRGTVNASEAAALTGASALLLVFAAYQLNGICFVLSPVALAIVFFYSFTKRFTWASHLFLGLALAIAPIGAWLAVVTPPISIAELTTPIYLALAVVFWLAGFDIIYSLQDREFDRSHGLYSIPVRFGIARALHLSSFFHGCTIVFLSLVGFSAGMGPVYWIGLALVAGVLIWEHRIVTPKDLSRINRAFFNLNAYVSIGYFLATVIDIIIALKAETG
jgi:4-hydroxybenzoate polyprenyltransferase